MREYIHHISFFLSSADTSGYRTALWMHDLLVEYEPWNQASVPQDEPMMVTYTCARVHTHAHAHAQPPWQTGITLATILQDVWPALLSEPKRSRWKALRGGRHWLAGGWLAVMTHCTCTPGSFPRRLASQRARESQTYVCWCGCHATIRDTVMVSSYWGQPAQSLDAIGESGGQPLEHPLRMGFLEGLPHGKQLRGAHLGL